MTVRVDTDALEAARELVAECGRKAALAMARGINKALTGVRADLLDAGYRRYNLTKKSLRDGTSTTRGRKGKHYGIRIVKATRAKLSGACSSTGALVPFFDGNTGRPLFAARQTAKGVTAKVLRNSSRKLIPRAFMGRMRSGHQGAFWRAKVGARLAARLPILELKGPRVEDWLGKEHVLSPIQAKAGDRLVKAVAHEADFILNSRRTAGDGDA